MSLHRFDVDLPHGIRLACLGNGTTPVRVLLLHGFPEAAFIWEPVMAALGPAVGCVAPNLRGYAGSSAPREAVHYQAAALSEDVSALIDHLAATSQRPGPALDLLVGHDWGGALAWRLAATRPEQIGQLLILNAPHPATFLRELRHNPAQQAASDYMHFLGRSDASELLAARDYARLWPFFGAATWLTTALRQRYRQTWDTGLEGPLNYYRASPLRPPRAGDERVLHLTLPEAAVRVTVPTTVIWGERDIALLPPLLDGLSHWVPRLQVHRLAQASHWLVHEEPDRVVQAIRELLQNASAPADLADRADLD